MVNLNEVMTISEVAELTGTSLSAVRKNIYRGVFLPGETRKALGTWLLTKDGVYRYYRLVRE